MNDSSRLALILCEVAQEIKEHLEQESFSIVEKSDDLVLKNVHLVLVNNKNKFDPFIKKVSTENSQVKILCVDQIDDIAGYFLNGGRAIYPKEWFGNEYSSHFFKKFLRQETGWDLNDLVNPEQFKVKALKIYGHLGLGSYSDLVCFDIVENGFNVVKFRNFFLSFFTYVSYLEQANVCFGPHDCEYVFTDKIFVMQVHLNIQNFYLDYLLDSLFTDSKTGGVENLMTFAFKNIDGLDIKLNINARKLTITAIYLKTKIKTQFVTLNEIRTFVQTKNALQEIRYVSTLASKQNDIEKTQKLEKEELPGKKIELKSIREGSLLNNPFLLKRVIDYCLTTIKNNGELEKIPTFTVKDIDRILANYPDKDVVKQIDDLDRETVLKSLQNTEIDAQLIKSLEQAEEQLNTNVGARDNILEEMIQRVSGSPEVEEIIKIKGSKEYLAEETTLVKGQKEDLTESTTVIKGSGEANVKEEITRIKGDNAKPEKEEVIRFKADPAAKEDSKGFNIRISGKDLSQSSISDILKKKVEELTKQGKSLKYIENEISKTMQELLGLSLEKSSTLVQNASDQAKAPHIDQGITNQIKQATLDPVELEKELKNTRKKAELDLKGKDEQLIRMKSLIDKMNKEIQTLKEKNSSSSFGGGDLGGGFPMGDIGFNSSVLGDGKENVAILKGENERLKSDIEDKEKLHKKQLENANKVSQQKSELIKKLEDKINVLDKKQTSGNLGGSGGPSFGAGDMGGGFPMGDVGFNTSVLGDGKENVAFLKGENERLKSDVDEKEKLHKKQIDNLTKVSQQKSEVIKKLEEKVNELAKKQAVAGGPVGAGGVGGAVPPFPGVGGGLPDVGGDGGFLDSASMPGINLDFINPNPGESPALLKSEITKLKQELEEKDARFEKFKRISENNDKNRLVTIENLEKKLEGFTKKPEISSALHSEKLDEILKNTAPLTDIKSANDFLGVMRTEVKRLNKELSDAKVNYDKFKDISDKNNKARVEQIMELEKRVKELDKSDRKGQFAARMEETKKEEKIRNELEEENKQLERALKAEKEKVLRMEGEILKKPGDDQSKELRNEVAEKEMELTKLKKDFNSNEAKIKEMELENKRLEHKAVTLEGKIKTLETALKGNNAKGGPKQDSAEVAKLGIKIKQMEAVTAKLTEQNKKSADELTAKKSELVKAKQEITQLQNKVTELERKTGQKKAS